MGATRGRPRHPPVRGRHGSRWIARPPAGATTRRRPVSRSSSPTSRRATGCSCSPRSRTSRRTSCRPAGTRRWLAARRRLEAEGPTPSGRSRLGRRGWRRSPRLSRSGSHVRPPPAPPAEPPCRFDARAAGRRIVDGPARNAGAPVGATATLHPTEPRPARARLARLAAAAARRRVEHADRAATAPSRSRARRSRRRRPAPRRPPPTARSPASRRRRVAPALERDRHALAHPPARSAAVRAVDEPVPVGDQRPIARSRSRAGTRARSRRAPRPDRAPQAERLVASRTSPAASSSSRFARGPGSREFATRYASRSGAASRAARSASRRPAMDRD